MSFHLSPIGNDQQFDANGDPLNGGKIYTYLAGTTTPVATYTDDTGVTPQANPIILNSLGAPASPIWLTGGVTYKFVIKDANDVTLRTIDDISGINDFTSNAADEWTLYGSAPTYTSATSFTLVGDQTLIFQVGRRLKSANTGGTIYSSILTSTYSAPNTTVTVVNDSGSLDAGMSAVSYALLNATNPSVPYQYAKKAEIQGQTYTAFTTAGTATAFTLTPNPAITALTANQRFRVKMDQANSGTTPTLAVSGLAATAIKMVAADGSKRDPVAGELAANLLVDMEYDGTNWVARAIAPQLATATPAVGTAAGTVGTAVLAARQDHAHPPMSGSVIKESYVNTATGQTPYTNVIPEDGTIPQNTEGDEIASLAFTPKLASSTLKVEFTASAITGGSYRVVGALFVDSTANALDTHVATNAPVVIRYYVAAGSTSARTYKVRFGPAAAGTAYLNGNFGSAAFGTLSVTEYAA